MQRGEDWAAVWVAREGKSGPAGGGLGCCDPRAECWEEEGSGLGWFSGLGWIWFSYFSNFPSQNLFPLFLNKFISGRTYESSVKSVV